MVLSCSLWSAHSFLYRLLIRGLRSVPLKPSLERGNPIQRRPTDGPSLAAGKPFSSSKALFLEEPSDSQADGEKSDEAHCRYDIVGSH